MDANDRSSDRPTEGATAPGGAASSEQDIVPGMATEVEPSEATFNAADSDAPPLAPTRPMAPAASPPPLDGEVSAPVLRKSRKPLVAALLFGTLVVAIALVVVFGKLNARQYAMRCEPTRVVAMVGRSFPPWGETPLDSAALAPIAIPPNMECVAFTTESRDELELAFLRLLTEQASGNLAAAAPSNLATLSAAQAQITQALILARDPSRRDLRNELLRLSGDVLYWQASAKAEQAISQLLDAATQFEQAAEKRPQHAGDAGSQAAKLRALAAQLRGNATSAKQPANRASTNGPEATEPLTPPSAAGTAQGSAATSTVTPSQPPAPASGGVLL